jgi:DNA-binding response OmpR family regulator
MSGVVVVVDDEVKLRDLVRAFLEREGFTVFTAANGSEALALEVKVVPDLVILDLGLPDIPGEEVARELRKRSDVRILMLTAKVTDEDRVRGLEIGADDYLTKPFNPRELVLRAQTLMRRSRSEEQVSRTLSFGAGTLLIDHDRHELRCRGDVIEVSPTEWALLETLSRTPGRVYSRSELVNSTRGYEWEGYERVVDSHVKNLRRKLGDNKDKPKFIETVTGAGYRFGLTRDR